MTPTLILAIVLLFILLIIGVPVALSFFLSAIVIAVGSGSSLSLLMSYSYKNTSSIILLTIPLFIMAGSIMAYGGIGRQIINAASKLVGKLKGGLAVVGIVACSIFAAISGSAAATLSSIGGIIGPMLREKRYPRGLVAAMMASAGVIGILIPPSGIMILYGWSSSTSVLACFLAGAIPGIILAVLLSLCTLFMLRNNDEIETMTTEELKATWAEQKRQRKLNHESGPFWALLMPVIILGCIYGGITTTTEAAAIATAYAIPVGFFVYKKLTMRALRDSFVDAAKATGTIMLLTLTVQMLSRMFIDVNLPKMILNAFYSVTDNRWGILAMINLFLIVLGMLMDDTSGTLLATPILVPIIKELGFSPVHFAAIIAVNLGMGNITPPVAPLLYFSSRIIDAPLKEMLKPTAVYFFFAWLPTLLLVTFVPAVSTWLPAICGYNI